MGDSPRLSLVTALPLSVWRDHVMPLLSLTEAAELRRVCKALKMIVEDWPMHLGEVGYDLEAALTCFPAAQSLEMTTDDEPVDPADIEQQMECLREHGGTLKRVDAFSAGAGDLLLSSVLAGALPNLSFFILSLVVPAHRQILSDGMLGRLEEVQMWVTGRAAELGALEHVRRLPHLRRIQLTCAGDVDFALPPFIPPSLKALTLNIRERVTHKTSMRDLPSMLQVRRSNDDDIDDDVDDW
jgi:hypothetical protein